MFLHFYLQQSSSTNPNGQSSSSGGDQATKTVSAQSTGSGPIPQPKLHGSHIITNQPPCQTSHRHYNNRPHNRGPGHYPRREPELKNPTGIPRAGLISIPRPIPGALNQGGAPVISRQMA